VVTAQAIMYPAGPASILSPGQLPRLLLDGGCAGPADLASHVARYGPLPLFRRTRQWREALIAEVGEAGLTGRGGAAFPTARKLAAVAAGGSAVVVGNGTEGEPASAKDKVLLARSPHLVLDGAVTAAAVTGASKVVLAVHRAVRDIVEAAAAKRRSAHADQVAVEVRTAAGTFVGGEASAVVNWIERGTPAPTGTPPRLSERGLGGAPTLVNNVETLAHLALIARYGAGWFRSVGTPTEPGSTLVTVLGAVGEPCVLEVAIGTPLTRILDLAGGVTSPLQALLIGGYSGTWVSLGQVASRLFSAADLADLGAAPGAGLIAALPQDACGIRETARVARYLAGQSAGQCGPCVFGLDAIAGEVERLAGGVTDTRLLRRWLGQVEGRGACGHPTGAVRLIASALTTFQPELAQHAHGWCCGTRAVLPVPARTPQ
jgi:NADH:ubiquinone oxidoreductase subunit F (NADH-binding)